MNTLNQLKNTLIPILEMTNLTADDFLIVGSAAEYIAGLGVVFGDVDIYVSPETFKRLTDDNFEYKTKHETNVPTRVIRIGMVDIVEHKGEWLNKPRSLNSELPILDNQHLIKWRIWMGRDKDQLKAWQVIHTILTPLQELLFSDPPLAVLSSVLPTIKILNGYQQQLMDMRMSKEFKTDSIDYDQLQRHAFMDMNWLSGSLPSTADNRPSTVLKNLKINFGTSRNE